MQDVIKMRGAIELALQNAHTGEEILRRKVDNLVVTTGRRFALQQICSQVMVTSHSIGYMAVGTGTAAPATSDSALGSETTRKTIGTFTTTNLTSNPPSWMAVVSYATNEANTTLGEAGLFNSSSGGTMLNRGTFTTLNKTTSNTLTISYTVSN